MRIRWELKRYDQDRLPHLDKAILYGRAGNDVASAASWHWSHRSTKQYLFKKVRMLLERRAT